VKDRPHDKRPDRDRWRLALEEQEIEVARTSVTLGRLRSLAEQLGNVETEVARATRAKAQGNDERLTFALARTLELFDFTLGDERWRGRRGLGAVGAVGAVGRICARGLVRPILAWPVGRDYDRHRPAEVVHAQIAAKPDQASTTDLPSVL